MGRTLRRLLRDETGATAIEYALIAALIGLAIVVSVTATGTSLQGLMNYAFGRATNVWDNAVVP